MYLHNKTRMKRAHHRQVAGELLLTAQQGGWRVPICLSVGLLLAAHTAPRLWTMRAGRCLVLPFLNHLPMLCGVM